MARHMAARLHLRQARKSVVGERFRRRPLDLVAAHDRSPGQAIRRIEALRHARAVGIDEQDRIAGCVVADALLRRVGVGRRALAAQSVVGPRRRLVEGVAVGQETRAAVVAVVDRDALRTHRPGESVETVVSGFGEVPLGIDRQAHVAARVVGRRRPVAERVARGDRAPESVVGGGDRRRNRPGARDLLDHRHRLGVAGVIECPLRPVADRIGRCHPPLGGVEALLRNAAQGVGQGEGIPAGVVGGRRREHPRSGRVAPGPQSRGRRLRPPAQIEGRSACGEEPATAVEALRIDDIRAIVVGHRRAVAERIGRALHPPEAVESGRVSVPASVGEERAVAFTVVGVGLGDRLGCPAAAGDRIEEIPLVERLLGHLALSAGDRRQIEVLVVGALGGDPVSSPRRHLPPLLQHLPQHAVLPLHARRARAVVARW